MKLKPALLSAMAVAFLAGSALPLVMLWNPLHLSWVGRLKSSLTRQPAEPAEGSTEATTTGAASTGGARKILYWRAPMDPNYISDKPGKSPMGMDLVPVYEDEQPAESGVRVDRGFLQNFSVRTAVAKTGSIPVNIRTIGTLTYNDKNITSVNTKFDGWIEKAEVNYIGEEVRKGQVLFEIFSPQLVTTQQEYLASLTYLQTLREGGNDEAIRRAGSLVAASRERLHYWDITEDQIDELGRSGKVTRTLKIVSPVSGVVIAKMDRSLEGMKLSPGANVFKIADLSTVWAEIEVYEYQLRYVRLGQLARITLDAFPGRRWSGKIVYLDPTLDQQTRTLKAYVEVQNSGLNLRPQMYANVELSAPAVSGAVMVPSEAVLRTGEKSIVIVQKAAGVFEPREVEVGTVGGGYQEIRQGLNVGETVVTSSQFLIDSESNLKEAVNQMLAAREQAKPAPQAGPSKTPEHRR
jgi:RND family efflux transporter MFP subunit